MTSIAISHDEQYVVAGWNTESVRMWKVEDRQVLFTHPLIENIDSPGLSFSPDDS
jgi:hypothetical protein